MAETTIEWTATRLPNGTTLPGYTFNPWEGCQKVGPGCDNCYAEARNQRFAAGANWGPHAPRRLTSAANWRKPIKWNKQAQASGIRRNVFSASLADVMDNHDSIPAQWRDNLAALIIATPHLNWLLLTKRIGNADRMLRQVFPAGVPQNLWLGATVVNQTEAGRDIPKLLQVRADLGISVAFLSVEPMLGAIDIDQWLHDSDCADTRRLYRQHGDRPICHCGERPYNEVRIDWVICGGESGPNARPMHHDLARSLRDQCHAAGVPFFFKQWGGWVPLQAGDGYWPDDQRMRADGTMGAGGWPMQRIGKARAGRLLDGREHNDMPGVM